MDQQPVVTLQLLGRFAFAVDGGPRHLGPVLQRLVAFLAVHPWPSRYVIASMLWPDHRDDAALAALRTSVWRLQHQVPGLLDVGDHTIALSARVLVDVDRCLSWATRLLRNPEGVPDDELESPVTNAELLPGWFDDWLEPERQRLHQLHVHALETAAGEQLRRGRPGQALATAFAALGQEPPSSHRLRQRGELLGVELLGRAVRLEQPAPTPHLLARPSAALVVLDGDARLVGQPLDRLGEREVVDALHERQHVAPLTAAEAVPHPQLWTHVERRRLLVVERAQPLERADAARAQGHVVAHDVLDGRPLLDGSDDVRPDATRHRTSSSAD
jgi:hypothetical protein